MHVCTHLKGAYLGGGDTVGFGSRKSTWGTPLQYIRHTQ